ncbi:MAG: peptidase [Paenibacillaceae bacterium]|jgi:murein DD-endopeptidase MepM/ murein hydrolase activator NlpD|nr:peptidase [Paenibacillaceae bacterium]
MRRQFPLLRLAAALIAFSLLCESEPAAAASGDNKPETSASSASTSQLYADRKALFEQISTVTGIAWNDLAAIDQYDRTISAVKKRPLNGGLVDIFYSDTDWTGLTNPDREDTNPQTIALFGGKGRDGDGDGKTELANDTDKLLTMAGYLVQFGRDRENFRIALWEHYQNSRAVDRITQFSKLYAAFNTLDLFEHAFPLPLTADYSYRSTWGASRGWGGYRIHEGTDLFAGYGVPARSACYGVIEVMGWNPYGGWRVGIRDLSNMYHYYAHLSGFSKEIKAGDVVQPGQVIGWVGSSGYGKPGTSGKFPPHLHYGLYRDNGLREWSFDPYPNLRKWEREEGQRGRKAK